MAYLAGGRKGAEAGVGVAGPAASPLTSRVADSREEDRRTRIVRIFRCGRPVFPQSGSLNSDYLRKRWHSPLICLVLRSGEVVLSSSLNTTTVKARKIFQASQQSGIFFRRKPVLFDKIFRSVLKTGRCD